MTDNRVKTGTHLRLVYSAEQQEKEQNPDGKAWSNESIDERCWHTLISRERSHYELFLSVIQAGSVITDLKKRVEIAIDRIIHLLREERALLNLSSINQHTLQEAEVRIRRVVEQSEVLKKIGASQIRTETIRRERLRIARHLLDVAERIYTREALEYHLEWRYSVHIQHSDVTRLLLYRINEKLTLPRILVLPNEQQPLNPFVSLCKIDMCISAPTARMLQMFCH